MEIYICCHIFAILLVLNIRGASACLDLSFRNIEQTVEIRLGNWGRVANGNKPSLLNTPSLFANNQVYLKETKFFE
jgi:hypothetical protein